MKKLFIAAMALASVVACSKDEVVDQQQSAAIGFEQAFVENATRATGTDANPSITTANIDAFDVWGFMDQNAGTVFEQQRVTKNGNDWTYSPLQYWLPGHDYYFGALAPAEDAHWTLDTANAGVTGVGTVSFENVNGTEDLVYASTSVNTDNMKVGQDMPKVGLTFSHLLSKVKFSFTNGFASPNYTISVKNIKMIVPAKAKIALVEDWWSTNKWTNYAGTTTLEFGDMNSERIQVTKDAESQKERLTIPAGADQEYVVTFDVELYQGDVLAYSNALSTTISGAELKIGNAYNFHATLDHTNIAGDALDPIEFNVELVKEWVDGNGYEGNVIDTKVVGVKNADELAAAAEAGATNFRLISDVNGTLTFSNTMRSAANYTLDLNGKTIDVVGDAIVVDNGVKLTINGNGTVKAGKNASGNALWVKHGNVTINGGSWSVGGDPNSTTGSKRNDCIYVGSAANKDIAGQFVSSVTINAGTFEAAVKELGQYWVLNIQDQFAVAGSTITVYGGSYKNFDPADNASEGANTNFVAQDYESVADGELFKVVPALENHDDVATADQLFAAVNAGGNITLTADITVSSPVIVEAGKVVNINLGGFTLKNKKENAATDVIIVKGNLSIDNGTVEAVTGNDGYAIISEGVLTINGGTYKSGVDVNNEPNAVIYARGNGEVYVNGGLFPNDYKSTFVLNKKDADRATTIISCTGGHFYYFNPADNAAENPGTNFCANGYKAQKQDDGSWMVIPN